MTEIILHIGGNKTGSSSIQRFIQRNAEKLRDLNFLIPDRELGLSEKITGEHVFALQNYIGGGVASANSLKQKLDELLESRARDSQKLLLSAENMGTAQAAKVFKTALSDRRVQVIFYIRRQDELIESSWQQWYSKINQDYDAWLLEAIRTLGHWEETLNQWEECVGQENIHLEVFEKSKFPKGNVIRDFVRKLGLGAHEDELELDLQDANPTYAEYITSLVSGNDRIFKNVHDNEFYRIVGALTGDRYTKEKKYSLMTRGQRENIVTYFDYQNERIRAKYFPDRSNLFSNLDHDRYNYLAKKDMADLQLKFMTTMIFELGRKIT